MKSWIAGTEYTLKKPVFCPVDGEGLIVLPVFVKRSGKEV
jgi:hypothetical protein